MKLILWSFAFLLLFSCSLNINKKKNYDPELVTLMSLLNANDSIGSWVRMGSKVFDIQTKELVRQEYNTDSSYAYIYVPISNDTAYNFFLPWSFEKIPSLYEVHESTILIGPEKNPYPLCITGDTARVSQVYDVFETDQLNLIQTDYVKMRVCTEILRYLVQKEFISTPKIKFRFNPGIMPDGSKSHHCINHS